MTAWGERMRDIDQWWPLLHEQIRRVLVNGIWTPVPVFSRAEIARLGGPAANDEKYWDARHGDLYLPHTAVQWIIRSPDFDKFIEVRQPDPRAAYFRRGWPRRQP